MRPVSKQPSVGLIILAAGESSRMGKPKQLLPFQGQSLIQYMVQNGLTSRCFPVVVVLGSNAPLIKLEIKDFPVFVAENPHWEKGMGCSISAGMKMVRSVLSHVEAVIVMLCDQPYVKATLLNEFIEKYQQTRAPLIASEYGGTLGVPALFDFTYFDQLCNLQGHEGARKILAKEQNVLTIPFPHGEIDLDTPEDYLKLSMSITYGQAQ
jgi:molybdenum cofactor cytidylyltransferase